MVLLHRLRIMQFLQFFLWGSWMVTFPAYALHKLHFSGSEIGAIYGSMGIVSLFMPGVIGIIADRWLNKEILYAILHIIGGVSLLLVSSSVSHQAIFWLLFVNSSCFMPTIPLGYTIIYVLFSKNQIDKISQFPKVRVWGTVGFVLAMWLVSLLHLELSSFQFLLGGSAELLLGVYALFLPACKPETKHAAISLLERFGLKALKLFLKPQLAVFFIFSALLGIMLQMSNTWSDAFLHSFDGIPQYADTFAVHYPGLLFSLSPISETVFILLIPFFLRYFGIKTVMIMSMVAWVIRFSFLAIGNPADGIWWWIASMLVYGCAFDFFNLSGSLFIELNTSSDVRASAQGLFMMMVNGVGACLGGFGGGWLVEHYTSAVQNHTNWFPIWMTCASVAGMMVVVFFFSFSYRHQNNTL